MHIRLAISAFAAVGAALIAIQTGALDGKLPTDGSGQAISPGLASAAAPASDQLAPSMRTLRDGSEDSKSGKFKGKRVSPTSPYLRQLSVMVATAEREANPDDQEVMLTKLVTWIEAGDAEAALRYLSEQETSDLGVEVQDRVLHHLAEMDPQKAANVASDLSSQNRWESVGTVLGIWAEADLHGAIAWVSQLPQSDGKQHAVLSIAVEAARTEPETALELVCELPVSAERDDSIASAAAQWATIDPASASAWAAEVDEGPLRDRLLSIIATAWGDRDPVAAATLALNALPPGKPQNDAVVGIVQRWTQQNPKLASEWVSAFPDGELRNAVVENFVKLWANRDPSATGNWLNTLAPGPSRDRGLRAFAEQIGPSSPSVAIKWASAISDRKMRAAQLEMNSRNWMQSDPVSATAWILKSSSPPAVRDRQLAR